MPSGERDSPVYQSLGPNKKLLGVAEDTVNKTLSQAQAGNRKGYNSTR